MNLFEFMCNMFKDFTWQFYNLFYPEICVARLALENYKMKIPAGAKEEIEEIRSRAIAEIQIVLLGHTTEKPTEQKMEEIREDRERVTL